MVNIAPVQNPLPTSLALGITAPTSDPNQDNPIVSTQRVPQTNEAEQAKDNLQQQNPLTQNDDSPISQALLDENTIQNIPNTATLNTSSPPSTLSFAQASDALQKSDTLGKINNEINLSTIGENIAPPPISETTETAEKIIQPSLAKPDETPPSVAEQQSFASVSIFV